MKLSTIETVVFVINYVYAKRKNLKTRKTCKVDGRNAKTAKTGQGADDGRGVHTAGTEELSGRGDLEKNHRQGTRKRENSNLI